MSADGEAFEAHYYLGRMLVDSPGHTEWEGSENVSAEVARARDILDDADPASREGRAAAILDDVLDGVPAHERRLPENRNHADAELRQIVEELDDNERAGLQAGMLPARYMDRDLAGGDVAWMMNQLPEGHL